MLSDAAALGLALAATRLASGPARDRWTFGWQRAGTVTSGVPVVSAHVVVEDEVLHPDRFCVVLDALRHCLEGHFDVERSTLQVEPRGHKATELRVHD